MIDYELIVYIIVAAVLILAISAILASKRKTQ